MNKTEYLEKRLPILEEGIRIMLARLNAMERLLIEHGDKTNQQKLSEYFSEELEANRQKDFPYEVVNEVQ